MRYNPALASPALEAAAAAAIFLINNARGVDYAEMQRFVRIPVSHAIFARMQTPEHRYQSHDVLERKIRFH